MKFSEVVAHTLAWLQRDGRVSYRALQREFELDESFLDDLKEELVEIQEVAVEKDGKMLVWVGTRGNGETEKGINGQGSPASRVQSLESQTPPSSDPRRQTLDPRPITYTPPHLAERIRAVTITDGERKTITALFADLKGSTALIEGLDPEEAQRVIDPALQLMMDAVHQYEGFVAQPLGDGIFALFGAPLAHEDHPQRALYAALRMQETMRRYADSLRQKGHPPLLMRVGLNTGEVVLRSIRKDDLRADYVPVGHSTNLAARMEQLATPGTIVVSAYTHRLTDGYFAFKDLGPTQIKGVADALHIYELQGIGPLRTRLQVSASRYGLTRFVGRHREMEQLNQALAQAKAGHGQIVGTMGEPGLGKSRLFYEFKLLSLGGCLVLEAYSVSHGKATAYLPVIELLKTYFRIEQADDERTRREKVNGKVLTLDRTLEDTLPYLFALLGIEEQPSPLAQMDPQIRRRRTFEALKKLFLRESLNQPLVLIFEDLHWIDGETQGFLDVLSESVASAKLLLLTNYRPEYKHEWGQKTYYTQLRLAPFGKEEAEEFLDVLLGQSPLPAGERARVRGMDNDFQALKQLILDKTQGTPFFMEEIVQELREQGLLTDLRRVGSAHQYLDLHLPPTVQAVLAARIDRLAPDEKALLQQLSVIGRQFPLSLIRYVITQPEADLYRLLASLQHKEFLYEQPAFPESEYLFKHALTQDVAYNTVLQEQKKVLHERTGQAIEQLYKDKLEEHYDELAHHYSRSGNTEKAIAYLHKAGQQAAQRSANTEAISHFSTALELLRSVPATADRDQRELTLQIALGVPLVLTKGHSAPEVEAAYTRARELCQRSGESPQLFSILLGLGRFYHTRGELRTARELREQLLVLAEHLQDSSLIARAHSLLGETLYFLGEFTQNRLHFEQADQAITLADPRQGSHIFLYGNDTGVGSRLNGARALWTLGYPDQALKRHNEGRALARELAHPFTLAMTLRSASWLHQLRREARLTQEHAEESIAFSAEHGFALFIGTGMIDKGWALSEQGQVEEGIARVQQGLVALRTIGAEVFRPYGVAVLAEAYSKAGQPEQGLAALAEALQFVEKNDERFYEAEMYRLKGELLLQQENQKVKGKGQKAKVETEAQSEAEECFRKAINIAQRQQAKSLELRAATSLARLWQQQGKSAEAHDLLALVYNWFTEGFDTKDLQEAKALLAELADREIGPSGH
jgi:class 3 adenylate cyclase/predicted ATPase